MSVTTFLSESYWKWLHHGSVEDAVKGGSNLRVIVYIFRWNPKKWPFKSKELKIKN